jgi:hypothetical protein
MANHYSITEAMLIEYEEIIDEKTAISLKKRGESDLPPVPIVSHEGLFTGGSCDHRAMYARSYPL